MLVVPASMTLAATSSNEVVSLGYIVVIDSERLTSSMLLMLEESTVTWISTGLPSNRIEAVYTPGQNLGASALSRGVSILEEAEAWGFMHIFIMDTKGIGYYAETNTIKDQSKEAFFTHISGDKYYVTETFVDAKEKKSITTITAPIKKDGVVIGNICGVIDLSKINEFIQNVKIGESGYAFLLRKNGEFVAHNDMSLVYNQVNIVEPDDEYSNLKGFSTLYAI